MSTIGVEYQMSIIEDRVNPLMERRELKFEVASKSTPKRDELRKAIASSLKVPIERVYIRNTISSFGTNISTCRVHIYDDAERAKHVEPEYIQMRNLSRGDRKNALAATVATKAAALKGEEKAQTGTKVK